jgi:hypothetical protein
MTMAKWAAIYDVDPILPQQGQTFLHCVKCMKELPDGSSPKAFARQQLAITSEGHFQLWCVRHDCNIALIEIKEKSKLKGGL